MTEVMFTEPEGPAVGLDLVRAYLSGGIGIVRRDAAVRLSYRGALVTENAGIVFTLASFYYIARLVHVAPFRTPAQYFAFAVVGIVIFGIVRSSLVIPSSVRQELVAGTYERLVLSPFGGTAATVSLVVFPLLYALLAAILQIAIAVIVFGMHLHWATAAYAIPLGIAGALAFVPFALLFAAVTLAFKQAPGQNTLLALISLASGLYFPVSLLPWWLHWISVVQPFTPTVDLMRHVLTGLSLPGSATQDGLKIAAFILIGIPIGIGLVSIAGRYGRRRGTVVEY